ncbi:MAG: V-type ATPase subunit, partial [Ruminococcus sp.]|nr:V-type ATPase subunit [Ruminococcus sp.]
MKDEDYAYAVARIRANEKNLLTNSDIDALIKAKTYDEAIKVLQSKGWASPNNSEDSVAYNQKKLWNLLCESVPDKSELAVFTVQNDFFNVKAALKCMLTEKSPDELFVYPTSLNIEQLVYAVKKHDFSLLGDFGEACKNAYETACQTQNGQNAEIVLDT